MLKTKFKFIITALVIMLLINTSCFATEEEVVPISEEEQMEINTEDTSVQSEDSETLTQEADIQEETQDASSEILEQDLYHFDLKDIKVEKLISGGAFLAGKNVVIDKQIAGNVFVVADKLTISSSATVHSSVYVIANEIEINGAIGNNLYAIANKVTISKQGYVYVDANLMANNVVIEGVIGRNACVKSNSITFNPENSTHINGNFNYATTKHNQISDDILHQIVGGTTTFEELKSTQPAGRLLNILMYTVFVILVGIALFKLHPEFVKYTAHYSTQNIFTKFAFGFVTIALLPIIAALLIASYVGLLAGLLVSAIFILLAVIAIPMFCISVTYTINKLLKLDNNYLKFAVLFGVSLVVTLLSIIPVVGILFMALFTILGIGTPLDYITAEKEEI